MKWISVKDQLPKKEETVLVFDGETIYTGHFTGYYWSCICTCNCHEGTSEIYKPIYWMPLPNQPGVDDE